MIHQTLKSFFVPESKLFELSRIDMLEAEKQLAPFQRNIACFGSARVSQGEPYYQLAYEAAKELSDLGYHIITGGGPGIMEASSKGGKEGKSQSIGLLIQLPHEQKTNPYLDVALHFKHFFSRKITFAKHSSAFVIMPGGFGTIDEAFEVLTLIQTNKMESKPVVFLGKEYWSGLLSWMQGSMAQEKMIDDSDQKLYHLVDSVEELVEYLQSTPQLKLS